MGVFCGRGSSRSGVVLPQSGGTPPAEEVTHSYTTTPGQSTLSLEGSPISAWSATSGPPVREEVQQLLDGIRTGAFQDTPHGFEELVAQLGARGDLNQNEFYAVVATLNAAINQRPSDYANPARHALLNVLQNNSHLPADLLVVASQLFRTVSPTNAADEPVRQAIVNILAGWTADGRNDLNFSAITNGGDFASAAEALRAAFHRAPSGTQEYIRLAMARLFEDTHLSANNAWRDLPGGAGRVQCAEVLTGYGNGGFISGDSPGAIRLRAALERVNHDATAPVLSQTPLGVTLPAGPGTSVNTTMTLPLTVPSVIGTTTPSTEERIDALLANPEFARALLASPTRTMVAGSGSPLQLSLDGTPGFSGIETVRLSPQQISRLMQTASSSPIPMPPPQLQGIIANVQNVPALQEHRDALGIALVQITERQQAALSDPETRRQFQQLLTHLDAQLIPGSPGHDQLRERIEQAQANLNLILPVQ